MKKVLAFMLATFLLFVSSSSALAVEQVDDVEPPENTEYSESATRVGEILEERTGDTKAFSMSDGTVEFELYAGDVHYQKEDGTWDEIDNRIVRTSDAGDGYLYKNQAGAMEAKFGDLSGEGILLTKAGHSIKFTMEDVVTEAPAVQDKAAMKRELNVVEPKTRSASGDNVEVFDIPEEAVTYNSADMGMDFVYSVENDRVKESIVLQAYEGVSEFTFSLLLDGLTMQDRDGEIVFVDDQNNPVFFLERPYAVDSNGSYCNDVVYEVIANDGDSVTLKTIVSEEFLASPSTAYPVLVDPTFSGVSTTRDTFVACLCANPNACTCSMGLRNFNTSAEGSNRYYLRTGRDAPYGVRRSYINFDGLHSAIRGKTIYSARLELYVDSYAGAINVYAQDVSSSWYSASTTMNWRTKAPTTTLYQSSVGSRHGNWYVLDVTSMANNRWRNLSSDQIYGMMLRDSNESSVWTTFRSADHTTVNTRPKLIVRTQMTGAIPWYAVGNEVGRWPNTPHFYPVTSFAGAFFSQDRALGYVTNAVSMWKGQGFDAEVGTYNDVPVYFGDLAQLYAVLGLGTPVDLTYYGLAVMSVISSVQIYTTAGTKNLLDMQNVSFLCIFEDTMSTIEASRKIQSVMNHEVGHALGYWSHSPLGLMQQYNSGGYETPTPEERAHLMRFQ